MAKHGKQSKGVRWQVPWGKHSPVNDEDFRRTHKVDKDLKESNVDQFLPVVTIRDPGVWAPSMCRHSYSMNWPHSVEHCPNIVPNEKDLEIDSLLGNAKSIPVHIKYNGFQRRHDSMFHHWNDWYSSYLHADFPHLLVRFEDLLFFPSKVTSQICECAGGRMQSHKFDYPAASTKVGDAHGKKEDRTGYMHAIIKYGTEKGRWQGMTPQDLAFAREHLDAELMKTFAYPAPILNASQVR
jgi:hypothetical protein